MTDRAAADAAFAAARDRLFEAARAVPVWQIAADAKLVGQPVKLTARGQWRRGDCPLCGGKRQRFAASADGWKCFGVCGRGDGVALVRAAKGCSAVEAALAITGAQSINDFLEGGGWKAPSRPAMTPRVRSAPDAVPEAPKPGAWLESWVGGDARNGVEWIAGWLAMRGISDGWISAFLEASRWRFGQHVFYGWWPEQRVALRAPAMMLPVLHRMPDGKGQQQIGPWRWSMLGMHATYFSQPGASLRMSDPADGSALPKRRMHGRCGGGVALLTGWREGVPLLVGEGVETTLSAAQHLGLQPGDVTLIAALSLDTLQGGWLADAGGCRSIISPKADPARPAFTLPEVHHVIIAVDADMSPLEARLRDPLSRRPVETMLDARARADVCGRLAARAWRDSGARTVQLVRPPLGQDFNDVVMEAAA